MSHTRILGVAALAAAATVITVMPSAEASTPSAPAFSGSTYAATIPGVATPIAADGFECKNLPKLPELPKLPDLSKILPKGTGFDVPPVTAGGDLDLAGFGTLSDMSTDTKLIKQADGSDGVTSTNTIGDITLDGGPLGTLDIASLKVSATATTADSSATGLAAVGVGDITLTRPDGTVQELSIPTPGNPTDVPGFARISLGGTISKDGADASSASAQGLVVKILKTGKEYVIGGASAIANNGDIAALAKNGELDVKGVIDLLCNADPATIFQKLAELPPATLKAIGLSVTKTGTGADAVYTGSFGDAGSLSLGLTGASLSQGLADLTISTTPDHQLAIGGDVQTDGPLTVGGTLLSKLPGLDKTYQLPRLASVTAGASTTSPGADVSDLTVNALDDHAKLVAVNGLDLTLTKDD